MPCYSPLQAYKTSSGEVVFFERRRFDVVSSLSLPCGQCIGCRLERSRQWAMRCMHEASLHEHNSFVTLTYSDENLPAYGSLDYRHYQLFMKRLRKMLPVGGVRFFVGGEYGETTFRPHYHACLFGVGFLDRTLLKTSGSGCKLYTSSTLEKLWPYGMSSIGDVTFESAAYVGRYCVKKVTGKNAKEYYERICPDTGEIYQLMPEFSRCSLKPAIGHEWLRKYKTDVFPHDYVIVRGKEVKPPKYYDKLLEKSFPDEYELVKFQRELSGRARYEDNTDERLRVKAVVASARLNQYRRDVV